MKTVSVGYAFPTSTHAENFGFEKEGCYVVEIYGPLGNEGALSGHGTLEEAKTEARKTNLPFNKYSL